VLESTNVLLALSWGNADNEKNLKRERDILPVSTAIGRNTGLRKPSPIPVFRGKSVLGSFPLTGEKSRFRSLWSLQQSKSH